MDHVPEDVHRGAVRGAEGEPVGADPVQDIAEHRTVEVYGHPPAKPGGIGPLVPVTAIAGMQKTALPVGVRLHKGFYDPGGAVVLLPQGSQEDHGVVQIVGQGVGPVPQREPGVLREDQRRICPPEIVGGPALPVPVERYGWLHPRQDGVADHPVARAKVRADTPQPQADQPCEKDIVVAAYGKRSGRVDPGRRESARGKKAAVPPLERRDIGEQGARQDRILPARGRGDVLAHIGE